MLTKISDLESQHNYFNNDYFVSGTMLRHGGVDHSIYERLKSELAHLLEIERIITTEMKWTIDALKRQELKEGESND